MVANVPDMVMGFPEISYHAGCLFIAYKKTNFAGCNARQFSYTLHSLKKIVGVTTSRIVINRINAINHRIKKST